MSRPPRLPDPGDAPLTFRGRYDNAINIVVLVGFSLYAIGEFANSGGRIAVIAMFGALYALFAGVWVRRMRLSGVRAYAWGIASLALWRQKRISWSEIDHFDVAPVGCIVVRCDGTQVQLLSLPPSLWGVGRGDGQRIVGTLNALAKESRSAATSSHEMA